MWQPATTIAYAACAGPEIKRKPKRSSPKDNPRTNLTPRPYFPPIRAKVYGSKSLRKQCRRGAGARAVEQEQEPQMDQEQEREQEHDVEQEQIVRGGAN